MSNRRKIDPETVLRVLMADDESTEGVFEQALGFRVATGAYKGVHLMNDLAQSVLGGAPAHGGNFMCRLIRLDIEDEDHSEATMRSDKKFGPAFERAFPPELGARRIEDLRRAARKVLNFDKGVFKPGDRMASALATHRALLGFEGFRRFRIGAYISSILTGEGRARLKKLFELDRDPISRAFRPILLDDNLQDTHPPDKLLSRTPFDEALGGGLSTLLGQRLSKPSLLRALSLGASFGIVLKTLGLGRPGGRPLLLALAVNEEGGSKPLREQAVASFRRGVEAMDRRVASMLPSHPNAPEIMSRQRNLKEYIEVKGGASLEEIAEDLVRGARDLRGQEGESKPIYWPERFAISFGRRAGCILPRKDHAGWGKHLALPQEMVETLILMFVPRGERPVEWRHFWRSVRERLGVVVGADASADANALEEIGVENVSLELLAKNAEVLLEQATRRGVARRLPDSGAEVGGELS